MRMKLSAVDGASEPGSLHQTMKGRKRQHQGLWPSQARGDGVLLDEVVGRVASLQHHGGKPRA